MGFVLDQKADQGDESRYAGEAGREFLNLRKAMILRLLSPRRGQRLLDVHCGAGFYLQAFKREGLDVTGLEPSPDPLERARARLGDGVPLFTGQAEDLPFEDNEFDFVTLIHCLEYTKDPDQALAEAIRVAWKGVFVGVLNGLSLSGVGCRFRSLLSGRPEPHRRHFNLWDLTWLLRRQAGPKKIRWATVGMLPPSLSAKAAFLEGRPLFQQSPFGSFLGVAVDLNYTLRTDNLTVKTKFSLGNKHAPSPTPTSYGPFRRNGPGGQ
ncbi:MAG: class I SAM-dependent methyltransferase [Pseudomonadota bacterium]